MIRLSYISRFTKPLNAIELANIEVVSKFNNKRNDICGVLLTFGKVFFQILEGDREKVLDLFEKIKHDDRHYQVTLLDVEEDIDEREFSKWNMKLLELDEETEKVMVPVRQMLEKLTATYQKLEDSHHVLETYTPASVITMLRNGVEPQEAPLERVEKIVLFSDIVAFSTLSAHLPVSDVVDLLNQYAEVVISSIEKNGGEVGKMLGDGIMAHFRGTEGDNALQASLDILEKLKKIRDEAGEDDPARLLYCGIGLSKGRVIKGNMGAPHRMDYTIIGDSVNRASRLEAVSREQGRALLFSHDLLNDLQQSWNYKSLEAVQLRGWDDTQNICTLNHPLMELVSTQQEIQEQLNNQNNHAQATA